MDFERYTFSSELGVLARPRVHTVHTVLMPPPPAHLHGWTSIEKHAMRTGYVFEKQSIWAFVTALRLTRVPTTSFPVLKSTFKC